MNAVKIEAIPFAWATLGILTVAQMGSALGNQGIPVLAPFYQQDLHLTRAQVGMVTGALYIGLGLSTLLSGWVTDYTSERRMMVLGLVILGAFAVLLALSRSFLLVLLVALMAGGGAGVAGPAITKAVVSWFARQNRGTAMGIKHSGVPLGGALAAAILPFLAVNYGWRPAVMALGSVILVVGLVSLIAYRDKGGGSSGWVSLGSGLSAARVVVLNRNIWLIAFLGLSLVGVQISVLTYLILYLKEALAVPVVVGGLFLTLVQLGGIGGRVAWGLVSDRLLGGRRKRVMILAGLLTTALVLLISTLPESTPLLAIGALSVAMGLTNVGWQGVYLAMIPEMVPPSMTATASGLGIALLQIGAVGVPPLFGFVVDSTHSYTWAWLFLGGLTLFGVLVGQRAKEGSAERP